MTNKLTFADIGIFLMKLHVSYISVLKQNGFWVFLFMQNSGFL